MHQANLNTDNGRMPQNIKCQKQIKNNEIIQQARKKKLLIIERETADTMKSVATGQGC